jgi:t-SNARE complex subunit (syntaxin)
MIRKKIANTAGGLRIHHDIIIIIIIIIIVVVVVVVVTNVFKM